jgi:hypothetical protein
MSVCIAIFENELERVAEKLDNKKFKYKFMFDSTEKHKSISYYNLDLLQDCLLFSGSSHLIRANRYKKKGAEAERAWSDLIENIFDDDRQITISNDFIDNHYMVLVFPTVFHDTTQRKGAMDTTLSDEIMALILQKFKDKMYMSEGLKVLSFEDYLSGIYEQNDAYRQMFEMYQKSLKDDEENTYKTDILNTFLESFKYRMISYYTKLREFGLDDIMRKLDELGYLDERFNNELYLYEEEARRLLAKRLCAISYKNDIELLISEGILKPEKITYNLNI